jgi:hypothetical protein
MSTNPLYELVNVFLPDGTWAGQFMDADTAKSWLKKQGHKLEACEVSKRSPERKGRNALAEPSPST